ncbi:hypothetical protein [Pusillimonas noertemannii]|uniref:Uncharacterized protein n=1 Tax=Pusillimonas noertemannii TaxID=305977 RepID=A0A2U1CRS2_9BURK|nr:hypothetical protein [Pusillimonas noertemannii]PVY68602.1 hypothetical protein C7440_1013 [Pusillimonas noertemannii]
MTKPTYTDDEGEWHVPTREDWIEIGRAISPIVLIWIAIILWISL